MKLSIIIPVYNVERYVERCINSCLNQDIDNNLYEIIIVNDGSKDKSLHIIQNKYAHLSNIQIINQENMGLSIARNNGLKLAKGDFVWFIDSDDWIETNCLSCIFKQLTPDLDFLQIQYRLTYDDETLNMDSNLCDINGIISGKEQILKGGIGAPAPFAIYRRKFLIDNNLFFYPKIYHEDSEFKPRMLYLAKKCTSLNRIVYNYYQRTSGSIMHSYCLKNALDILIVIQNLCNFIIHEKMTFRYKKYFYRCIGQYMNSIFKGYSSLTLHDKEILSKELRNQRYIFSKMILSFKIVYVVEALLFFLNFKIGFAITTSIWKKRKKQSSL